MEEYRYIDGAKVLDLVASSIVDDIKDLNCYEAACEIAKWLLSRGVRCSVVNYKNGNVSQDGCLTVWNDYAKAFEFHTHQSIVLLGDCVIDVFHSDKLIKTSDYMRSLGERNSKLTIAGALTHLCNSSDGSLDFRKSDRAS